MKALELSLIIPCYNNASTLENFFSVLNKINCKSFEVILVNDGSTDNTEKVLKNLSQIQPFGVKVIKQKNMGPGTARNNGLKQAEGKYVWFIDSDDFFNPEALPYMLKILSDSKADILTFDYKIIQNENQIQYSNSNDYVLENSRHAILFEPSCPWSKIYRRSFLVNNKIVFPPYYFAEDLVFNIRAWVKADKIIHLNQVVYNYFQRTDSISNTWVDKHISEFIEVVKLLKKESEINKSYREEICYIICRHIESFLSNVSYQDHEKEVDEINSFVSDSKINENTYESIRNELINKYEGSFRWKITEPLSKVKKMFKK